MGKKPKAGGVQSGAKEKMTQRERFIATAREIGVDETGVEFETAIKRVVPPKTGAVKPKDSSHDS